MPRVLGSERMWAESTGQLSWVGVGAGVGSPMTAGGGDDGHCPDFDLRNPCWIIFLWTKMPLTRSTQFSGLDRLNVRRSKLHMQEI